MPLNLSSDKVNQINTQKKGRNTKRLIMMVATISAFMGWSADDMICYRTGIGYQELEWIGVGTAIGPYFDTGYVPHNQDKVEAKILLTEKPAAGDISPLCDARSSVGSFGIIVQNGRFRRSSTPISCKRELFSSGRYP